jgi:putative hydrolase of the HAD superfamily
MSYTIGNTDVSFDLWNTLIVSNPAYKNAFYSHLHEFYLELIDNEYYKDSRSKFIANLKHFDIIVDALIANTHTHVDRKFLLALFFRTNYQIELSADNLQFMCDLIDDLFLLHQPILMENAFETLEYIHKKGYWITLISNTCYIPGSVLEKTEAMKKILPYLDFRIYSDQFNISKPNPKIWECAKDNDSQNFTYMHIGDTLETDGGCILDKEYEFVYLTKDINYSSPQHKTINSLIELKNIL